MVNKAQQQPSPMPKFKVGQNISNWQFGDDISMKVMGYRNGSYLLKVWNSPLYSPLTQYWGDQEFIDKFYDSEEQVNIWKEELDLL